MKIVGALTVLVSVVCASEISSFRPPKVSFDDLLDTNNNNNNNNDASGAFLLDALQNVGMISITNMPESFRQHKKETLSLIHACAMESALTNEHVFPDGTRRLTMATHTIPGPGGIQPMHHCHHDADVDGESSAAGLLPEKDDTVGGACKAFEEANQHFRQMVDMVTRAFAIRLGALLQEDSSSPLLQTSDGFEFKTVQDVVENGEHLEHFHSYQAPSVDSEDATIEWHTDQGLFLVFTPGVMVQQDKKILGDETEGFYVELKDGSQVQVEFDRGDDLVILLGDGVNQYVNPNMVENSSGRKLRAVPHALSMTPNHDDTSNLARVWYGRMVLPPASAIHPQHGESFGHLRQLLIGASLNDSNSITNKEILSMGCSSPSMRALQAEISSCEEGTLLCWHRCMSLEEQGVSDEICSDQSLDLRCINPRMQLWDGDHGDFFPGCINASAAEVATPFPTLPDYPRDEDLCTDAAYDSFVETASQDYNFTANLTNGGVLMWSVDGDKVNGMLAFNGLFGYVGLGFAGDPSLPGGSAMNGAIIIFATPSDSYSPVTGFDMTKEPLVEEYIIDPVEKSFRLWMTPVTSTARAASIGNVASYSVQETECFTTMSFNTPGIFNTTFNITGKDDLIWAANGVDMFAGYHGAARGKVAVEWSAGKVHVEGQDVSDPDGHDDHDHDEDAHDHEEEGTTDSMSNASPSFLWNLGTKVVSVMSFLWMVGF